MCRGRGCWRTEGWAPELKQKRGRPASAVADGHELAVQSFISSILQIEGQRYKLRHPPFVAALALTASPQSPNPLACASQVLRPDQRPDAAPRALRRCRAVEPLLPRARHVQDERAAPGLFPDKRWVTLADLKASEIPVATIKEKLDEFEAAATAKRNEVLDAPPPPAAGEA